MKYQSYMYLPDGHQELLERYCRAVFEFRKLVRKFGHWKKLQLLKSMNFKTALYITLKL